MKKQIAYYVSAHGYGHGVRSADIIRELERTVPELGVELITRLPASAWAGWLGHRPARIRDRAFDVGMVQLDSIRVDVPATLERVEELYKLRGALIEEEMRWLEASRIDLVVCDIPAIPLRAAAQLGLPRLAIGNFGWDWIYRGFHSQSALWEGLAETFASDYAQADLLLRLPFAEPMTAFLTQLDLPLLAEPGRTRRESLAEQSGADPKCRWILVSFGSLGWDERALDRVAEMTDYEFFAVRPLAFTRRNIHTLERRSMPFSDVVASVDAVLTKPGFGIVSDCVVNEKPMLYADRKDFKEYPILVEAIERYLQNQHVTAAELYAGEIEPSLEALWERPLPDESLARGGAAIAARQILQRL